MSDYIHGVYSSIKAVGTVKSNLASTAMVYVGTAPVQTVAGGASNVNVPVVVENIAQARAKFGYSDDWAKYTLCEAMKVHLQDKGVGPLILINVLDTVKHKDDESVSISTTPSNGQIVITSAEDVILDSVKVTGKTLGTDYTISYSWKTKKITIAEITSGGLGTAAVNVSYDTVDATKVTDADIIGSTDVGTNEGVYAVKSVYEKTGYVPSFLCAPGWSSVKAIHAAMEKVSLKVNGHWDMYMFVDMPLTDGETAITMATAAAWKTANGYNNANETVYFPMAAGVDGNNYHLSVLAAANMQELLLEQDGIPYKTASNTETPVIESLYLGTSDSGKVYDDSVINEYLNKHGIASAAFVGGRWAIWGAHGADYDISSADYINISETSRMMLYYLGNDFQKRRWPSVDQPMSKNMISSIVSEEQARLDALVKIGALTFGEVNENAEESTDSDIANGDLSFVFNITTTPLAKSMTAVVQWTDEGLTTYYA